VLQLGKFDLQFALVALGAQGKDVEDQAGAIDDATFERSAPGCVAGRGPTHG
jgi:hypothetical protein